MRGMRGLHATSSGSAQPRRFRPGIKVVSNKCGGVCGDTPVTRVVEFYLFVCLFKSLGRLLRTVEIAAQCDTTA